MSEAELEHTGTGSYGFTGGSGLPLDKLYSQARRTLLMARDGLERLERLEMAGQPSSSSASSPRLDPAQGQGPAAPDLVEHLKKEIGELQASSVDLDRLWRNQVLAKGQRDLWKRRVEQVAEEVESLKAGLDRYLLRQHRRQVEAQERAELFRRTRGDGAHILQVHDVEMQALQSAKNSSRILNETLATGVAVLGSYAVQRDRLKAAQRKAYDVLNTVGLGNKLTRLIERRQKVDKWIAYGGMLVTIIILIVVIRWFR